MTEEQVKELLLMLKRIANALEIGMDTLPKEPTPIRLGGVS